MLSCSWERPPSTHLTANPGLDEVTQPFSAAATLGEQCESSWKMLAVFLLRMLQTYTQTRTEEERQMLDIYEREIARGQRGISYSDLHSYLERHPLANPSALIEEVLFDPEAWSAKKKVMDRLETKICVFPGQAMSEIGADSPDPMHSANGTTTQNRSTWLEPRYIDSRQDIPHNWHGYYPTFGMIISGILRGEHLPIVTDSYLPLTKFLGDLSLHYAMFAHYTGTEAGRPSG